MARRITFALALLTLCFVAAAPAMAGGEGSSRSTACVGKPYSYAGLTSNSKAHGVSATVVATAAPSVIDGHVGGWIGVGGVNAGPGGKPQWLQVGLSAFTNDRTSKMYYEVTRAGSEPRYVELSASVARGEKHRFSVLEMAGRTSWWRVWVDSKPVSPPIHLPGSHGTWYPQAVAENWNGGTGTCNGFSYKFSNVALAHSSGGDWQPLTRNSFFEDAGYKVVETSGSTRTFLATSL
jgi:hypothetical protein